jgi:uncharacterized protein (DUF1697 family)
MPALREQLTAAGFDDVRTYVQSGNVVLRSDADPEEVARECERQIAARFEFDVEVVVRTAQELADVVRRNPLGDVAVNPKRYQVSFLSAEPDPAAVAKVETLAVEPERFVAIGREAYMWTPDGVARSKLWAALAGQGALGVTATARNWTTVTTLLAMAIE